jgi:hypothetical protein
MAFGCLLRDDERKKKRNWFAIGRVEGNGNLDPHEHSRRRVALRHARVGNRDAMSQASRANCSRALRLSSTCASERPWRRETAARRYPVLPPIAK